MPFGILIVIGLVAVALYFDRGTSDHDNAIHGDSKTNHLT
jgi:hypothetical protein